LVRTGRVRISLNKRATRVEAAATTARSYSVRQWRRIIRQDASGFGALLIKRIKAAIAGYPKGSWVMRTVNFHGNAELTWLQAQERTLGYGEQAGDGRVM